ncbi:MAG: outer membrane beta-barrel domain-containing protein [Myxococcales bacterium]|nr:outer membrane beta-barrel domain-containing protein [Myxococcales bacterium]
MRRITQCSAVRLLAAALLIVIATSDALAEQQSGPRERKSPLENAPAIRHRYELRDGRFELGPSFHVSLNRSLRNAVLFGARLQYHINDFLSVGADVAFGVSWDAVLATELEDRYNAGAPIPAGLSYQDLKNRFSEMQLIGDVRLTFTPFAGKMAMFGKLFFAYDFYVFAGFGFGLTKNKSGFASADDDVNATNSGFNPGVAWGIGFKLFFTNFFAVGFEFRDVMFSENETGQDNTRGIDDAELVRATSCRTSQQQCFQTQFGNTPYRIDSADRSFLNHFFFGLQFTFFFPTVPVITD